MSRRNKYRRPQDAASVQAQDVEGQQAAPNDGGPRPSVITLHLGGKNPFRCYNAYLITGSRHVLVDPGPPGSAGELLEQLSRHRISLGDIGLIVITHGHPDHFGSASQYKEWTRAPLAVHELDAEYVNFGSVPVLKPTTRLGSLFKSLFNMKANPVEPDIILRDGDKLNRYAGQGRVVQTPGHTAGSISILLPDGNCIVGDLLMRGLSARTPSLPWFAENESEVRESLQRVVNLGARTLLAGHGGPFDVEQLASRFPWLEVPERIKTERAPSQPVPVATASARRASESVRESGDVSQLPAAGERQQTDTGTAPAEGVDRPRRRRPRRRHPRRRDENPGATPTGSDGN